MAWLKGIAFVLILTGCNKSDNSVSKDGRSDSAIPTAAGNANIVDERTFEEPVLESAANSLEQTPITISDLFAGEAALEDSVRLNSLLAASRRHRINVSELEHAIRADRVPDVVWKEVSVDAVGDSR